MSRTRVAAIILAAGQSRRMGQPKMLLPWAESTVLGQVIAVFAEAGVEEIVVVTGAQRQKVDGLVAGLAGKFPLRSIHNAAYRDGEMLSSLQCGLAELGPELDAAFVGLGDQPQIESRTVRSLLAAFESSRARIVVPSYKMRRGHPWLVQKSLWDEIRAMKTPQTSRDFLQAHADEIKYVTVDTPSVIEDLDTPEDYKRHL